MRDTYFVEERSGVIGIGPLTTSPQTYYRRPKTDWGSILTWLHFIICIIAVALIIWNLYVLMDAIILYSANITDEGVKYTDPHPFAVLVVMSAILMNLLGGVFALVTETACFSENIAKIIYATAYLSIAISIFGLVMTHNLIGPLWQILLFFLIILYGFGFWRFIIISTVYLNEEGPVWFKPLLYFCLAAIPILTTGSQCRKTPPNVHVYGCLPVELFGGREMYMDFHSFTGMIVIAIISAIPWILGVGHNLES